VMFIFSPSLEAEKSNVARVDLPFVFAIRRQGGRKGDRSLWYFRRAGYIDAVSQARITRLPGRPGEVRFDAAYRRCVDESERQRRAMPAPPGEGSFARLVVSFRGDALRSLPPSPAWTKLSPRTRQDYGRILDRLAERFGDLKVADLDQPRERGAWLGRQFVKRLQADYADRPREADHFVTTLRRLFNFAIDLGLLAANPAARPGRLYSARRRQLWSWAEEEAFLAGIDAALPAAGRATLRLFYLLLAYTGQRPGDVLAMRWDQLAERELELDGRRTLLWCLEVRQQKTAAFLWVPVHERLLPELLAARAAERAPGRTIIATRRGAPWSLSGIAKPWAQVLQVSGVAGLQRRDLRRTAVVRLAEAGCTVPQIAAISGHSIERTTQIVETYLPRSAAMAAAGIVRLERHMRKREETS